MSNPRSNLAKYATKNPVVLGLIGRYFGTLEGILRPLRPASILDVGCGEGITAGKLAKLGWQMTYEGLDADPDAVAHARRREPGLRFDVGDVYHLGDRRADVVICLEVLEHLEDPARALDALKAAAGKHVVVSVPWEPWFRTGNLMRGKYLKQLGNHPEHIQQLSPGKLEALLRTRFERVEIITAFPWVFGKADLGQAPERSPHDPAGGPLSAPAVPGSSASGPSVEADASVRSAQRGAAERSHNGQAPERSPHDPAGGPLSAPAVPGSSASGPSVEADASVRSAQRGAAERSQPGDGGRS